MADNQSSVGPPTEKTLENIRRARAHSVWVGPVHVEWSVRTRLFFFWPKWEVMNTEFWNEGPVRWFRVYWLTFGLSVYRVLPERRFEQEVSSDGFGFCPGKPETYEYIERRGRGVVE